MAETIKIEIPITAKDDTAAGIKAAEQKLTAFEKRFSQVESRLSRIGGAYDIEVGLDDNASSGLGAISDRAESLGGMSANVEIGVSNNASATLSQVSDQAEALSGMSGDVEIGADDNASSVIDAAADKAEAFGGMSASATIGTEDNASPTVDAARDKVEAYGGMEASAQVGVEDNASQVLDGIMDKLSQLGGTSVSPSVGVNAATGQAKDAASSLAAPIVAAAGGVGAGVFTSGAISTYGDFQSMMSQVQAISGAGSADMEALSAKAKEMGATTKFTATEAGEAFNYMAMAGWKTEQMLGGIEGIMSLAAASGESLGSTSDIVTDALTAFGMGANESGRFADVLAAASSNANTNVGLLGESFKYVAPVAGAMNYSVEDISTALGLMANASVKGSMAGTALKTAMANLASPTDTMAEAMDKYGISITDAEGNMKTWREVMDNLRTSLGGLGEAEQTAAASDIFGKEAMAGMLAIINASEDDYNKLTKAIDNSEGSAKQMADTMMNNMQGSLTLMSSAIDGVKNSFGERLAPYITGIAEDITAYMPQLNTVLQNLMDNVDGKIESLKNKISTMTLSDEWQNADLFGKIDIAWDTLIADPLSNWINSTGIHTVSGLFSDLFNNALKILPGGEEAGISSWISAAIIGIGGFKAVSGVASILTPIATGIQNIVTAAKGASSVGDFASRLGGFSTAGMIAAGIALAATAITALALAIDAYNQRQINDSLAEHFGNISLTAKEVQEAASGILNLQYEANVKIVMDAHAAAEQARQDAQAAVDANNKLVWKSAITNGTVTLDGEFGVKMDEATAEAFKQNVEDYIQAKINELQNEAYAAYVGSQTFLGASGGGQELASKIQEWATIDNLDLSNLSSQLRDTMEDALEDGILTVSEDRAISAIQEKIDSITGRWARSQQQAALDMMDIESGKLSGKNLTADSFKDVAAALDEQEALAYAESRSAANSLLSILESANEAGRLGPENGLRTMDEYKTRIGEALRNQRAQNLMNSMDWLSGTLKDAYAENIEGNSKTIDTRLDELINSEVFMGSNYGYNGGLKSVIAGGARDDIYEFMTAAVGEANSGNGRGLFGIVNDRDQAAMNDVWDAIKPTASKYQEMMAEYTNMGQEIPEKFMNSFYDSMKVGAAAGDKDAAMYLWAKAIADSGDEALKEAIGEMALNEDMYGEGGLFGDQFADAWKLANSIITDNPADLEGLTAEIEGLDNTAREAGEEIADAANDATDAVVDGAESGTAAIDDETQAMMDLANAFAEAYVAANEAFTGMFGLFDTAQANMDATVQSATDALTSQLKYWTEYGSNLEVIRNFEPPEASGMTQDDISQLLSFVSDGSADSAGLAQSIADAITTGGEEGLEQLQTLLDTFREVEAARSVAAQESAAAATGYDADIDLAGMMLHGDLESAQFIFDNANIADKVEAALEAQGIFSDAISLPDGQIQIDLGEVDVNDSNVQQQIADALGTTVDNLQFEPATVDMPATVTIPEDQIDVNFDELYAAIEVAAETAEGAETPDVTTSADATVNAGTIDSSQAYTDTQTEVQTAFDTAMPIDGSIEATLTQTNNAADIYEEVNTEVQTAFDTTMTPINGSADVTLTQTNNADAIYSEVASEVQTAFNTTINANAHVNVNVSWSLTNGSNSVTTSDGQTVNMSASLAHSAVGRYVDDFMVSTLGEDGPEYVIPVGAGYRDRGLELWAAAGRDLGVPGFAEGGYVGGNGDDWGGYVANGGEQKNNNNNIQLQVTMSPTIRINGDGMDEDKIVAIIQEHNREMADDTAEELAKQLGRIFENMPMQREA